MALLVLLTRSPDVMTTGLFEGSGFKVLSFMGLASRFDHSTLSANEGGCNGSFSWL